MQPLVSVIIPIYNHAPYLKERIESVINQTYSNIEVIMLDDCSPDNSADVMFLYKDNPRVVHASVNETNTGNTFIQWERGISMAKGEYVWIAESDDVADITFVSKLMMRLTENPDAVLAYSYSNLIDSNSQVMAQEADKPWLYEKSGVYDSRWFLVRRLSMANLLYNASMIIFKRECFKHVSPMFKEFRHCGDWLFWFEICRQGRVVEVPEKLNMFRQHPQKVTRHGDATGDGYRELGPIMTFILDSINATPYQRRVIRGRMTKRLRTDTPAGVFRELSQAFPHLYGGNILDTIVYVIDKKTNKSMMQYK